MVLIPGYSRGGRSDTLTMRDLLAALTRRLVEAEEQRRTLFEALPQGLIHYGADGSIIAANHAASEILGLDLDIGAPWPLFPLGKAVREDGSAFEPEDLPVRVALRTGEIVAGATVGVRHGRSREMRWLQVTAVPNARDEQGRPRRVYAVFADVTDQRRLEAALRESTSLLAGLQEANVLGVVASTEQGIDDANDTFLDLIGYSRDDLRAGRISFPVITAPESADAGRAALEQLRSTGVFQPFDKEYVHRDGHLVPVLVGGAVISRDPLRWVTFAVDLTARQRAAAERAELRNQERAARAEAETARERLWFLLRAGSMLAATRDRHELLEHAAQLVVPGLADYCVVFLPNEDGRLVATSLAHRDPARAVVLSDLRKHPIPAVGPMTVQAAYTRRASQLVRNVTSKQPTWTDLGPALNKVLARLQGDTVLATPLMAGHRPLGVLALVRGLDRASFSATDTEVVEEFARRLADGMINADTFAREHTIAETLQHAVLPGDLPDIPGLELAVRYLPATDGVHVGGDWYDAFPVGGDRVGLVIGDVAGHSIASASIMGQVRSVLRAYAIDDPDPPKVLRRTNAALSRLLPEAMATVVYGVLDMATGRLSYANAGHPPPLFTSGTGQAEYLRGAAGIVLGACADTAYTGDSRRLPAGAGLLFYTDGLIEDRRRDITDGFADLARVLRHTNVDSAERTCSVAESALLGSGARADDVCLLAVKFRA